MPTLDIFNADAFNCRSLSAAIDKLPFKAGKLGELGLFTIKSVSTAIVQVEERNGRLSLVQSRNRKGGPSNYVQEATRKMHPFNVPHVPENDAVYAEDVQGVRAFGSETELETVSQVVADKLQAMKDNLEVTKEYHRIGAIQGIVLDADGSELADFFEEFEVSEDNITFDISDDVPFVKCTLVIRTVERALGGTPFDYVMAVCGDNFWDGLVGMAAVKTAYTAYVDGGSDFLKNQQRAEGFFYGGIFWTNYRGSVGSLSFIDTNTARFFPVGVPNLFQEIYAPANYNETVNTMGQPYYSKQERMKYDKGIELEAQTNPLMICNRPACLVKGTIQA